MASYPMQHGLRLVLLLCLAQSLLRLAAAIPSCPGTSGSIQITEDCILGTLDPSRSSYFIRGELGQRGLPVVYAADQAALSDSNSNTQPGEPCSQFTLSSLGQDAPGVQPAVCYWCGALLTRRTVEVPWSPLPLASTLA
jgi:hypothetical protein